MKQRLISLCEEKDKLLEKLAKERGGKKGSISSTIEDALDVLARESRRELAWKKLKAFADADIDLKMGKFDRDDANER